jgi:tetratricopeptide (TPR) repeat protein
MTGFSFTASPWNHRPAERRTEHEKGIKAFGEAIRINPDFPRTNSNRGEKYLYLGETDKALEDFDVALRPD